MKNQRVRASKDISHYYQALHLPPHRETQELQLFDEAVAADRKGKQQRLKTGAFIDQYSAVILARIHLASRIVYGSGLITIRLCYHHHVSRNKQVYWKLGDKMNQGLVRRHVSW